MKKKIFTLLTLLLCVCTGAWADDLCSAFLNDTEGSSTTTNCTFAYYSSEGSAGTIPAGTQVGSTTYYVAKMNNDANYYQVTYTGGFKAGDVVTVYLQRYSGTQAYKVGKTAQTEVSASNTKDQKNVAAVSHTLTAAEIESDGTLRIYRNSSNTYFAGLSVTSNTASPTCALASASGEGTVGNASEMSVTSTNAFLFQWYSNTTNSNENGTIIAGATSATYSYTPVVGDKGKSLYFYCVATNPRATSTTTATSGVFTLNVANLDPSDLAIKTGKGTQTLSVAGTLTFTDDVDYTSSSTGDISLTSSVAGVVTIEGATITAVGAGKTTITLTQAADASYAAASVEYTINVLPKGVLDLSNATNANNMLKNGWVYDTPYFTTSGGSKVMIFSLVSANQSQAYQTWVSNPKNGAQIGGASTRETWSSSGIFKGGLEDATTYCIENGQTKPSYTTINPRSNPYRTYYLRVKGATKMSALVKGGGSGTDKRIYMSAYVITDGVAATDSTGTVANSSNGNLSVIESDLDAEKEYLIHFYNSEASNRAIYEVAFYYNTDGIGIPENRIKMSAAGWASYTPVYKVNTIYKAASADADFKAYKITGVTEGAASTVEVTGGLAANNGFFVKGTANKVYRTAVTTGSVTAPTDNLIKGQTTSGIVKTDGDATRYALLTYDADNYGLYKLNTTGVTIPAGKAYLEISTSGPGARALDFLSLDFDDNGTTGLAEVKSKTVDVKGDFYDLSGRKVAQPTKGLYIVNGKKVVIK